MKLFSDMTPLEKLEHIQRSIGEAEDQVRAKISRLDHADEALNLFDDWLPYMLERMRKLEAVAAAARMAVGGYCFDHGGIDLDILRNDLQNLQFKLVIMDVYE